MVFAAADFDCVFTWVWIFVFSVWGVGFRVWGLGFKSRNLGFGI